MLNFRLRTVQSFTSNCIVFVYSVLRILRVNARTDDFLSRKPDFLLSAMHIAHSSISLVFYSFLGFLVPWFSIVQLNQI
jgi:hypothetical protein